MTHPSHGHFAQESGGMYCGGIHMENHLSTSTKKLFATLKAHSVQAEFMKLTRSP